MINSHSLGLNINFNMCVNIHIMNTSISIVRSLKLISYMLNIRTHSNINISIGMGINIVLDDNTIRISLGMVNTIAKLVFIININLNIRFNNIPPLQPAFLSAGMSPPPFPSSKKMLSHRKRNLGGSFPHNIGPNARNSNKKV